MHDCLTGTDVLYKPLLLGVVNGVKDLAASAMEFAPGVWLTPLFDSGNVFGAVCSESAFTSAHSGGREFSRISKIEDRPSSFRYVERSQYQDVWNDSDKAEFSSLWNSNAFRCPKKGELPKNANVVTGKWVRS